MTVAVAEASMQKTYEEGRKIMYTFDDLGIDVIRTKDEAEARKLAEIALDGCLEMGYDPRPGKRPADACKNEEEGQGT